ncbi:MAG TPA: sigma 54-interacting transcriptional regulator, partial [Vicinamibacterales bacterium]|nr:sigma 54-interacting transcriptional regulator [Vicinamibacterales bacterium]
ASIDRLIFPSITTILLMDPDGLRLRPIAGPKVPEEWTRAISSVLVDPDAGLCNTAAALKTRVIVPDVAKEPIWLDAYRDLALTLGIRAGWSQPIVTKENQVLGTFAVYSPECRVPTDDDLALIEAAGHVTLLAIERQRSHEALTSALADARKSETELRRMTDAVAQSIVVLNPDGKAISANRVALEYTGLSLEEVQAIGFRERVFHPDDIARLHETRLRALSGTMPFENEQRVRRADGQYRWFLIQYKPVVDDDGHVACWYATGTDIEDRKRAENKLRQDERELRQLMDALPQHVLVLDKDGALLLANRTMLDYIGCTLEEMCLGTREPLNKDVHPDDLERIEGERSLGLSNSVPFEMERRLLGKDREFRWFLFRYNPVMDEDGAVVRWFATATDIEERRQTEDRMRNETVALREAIVRSSMQEKIVGSSPSLRRVLAEVERVAATDSTVLILGETGTGKELIAREIHNRSTRASRAFVSVNCAAIPSSLIASELFGHEKGAFTGAIQRRIGRFESADGGTLFLDEIGDLPPETQVALLRALQERTFERIGGLRPVAVDVRVLAATNRDLDAAIAEGSFRKDLFYRLNVFPVHVPALRERGADIPLLVEYLVARYAQKTGKRIQRIGNETMDLFKRYSWPGNVRELQNVIERAVILCDGETFSVDASWFGERSKSPVRAKTLASDLSAHEKTMIENALRQSSGRVSGANGAASILGMPRQTLESKLRRLGIKPYHFRTS